MPTRLHGEIRRHHQPIGGYRRNAFSYAKASLADGRRGRNAARRAWAARFALLLQLGAAVAAGIPLAADALPAPRVSGKVVFLAAEDPAVILARRAHFLMKCFAAQGYSKETLERLESHFQLSSLVGAAPKLLPIVPEASSMLDRLEVMATGARLLIFDPIRSFHDCNEEDHGMMSLLVKML